MSVHHDTVIKEEMSLEEAKKERWLSLRKSIRKSGLFL